MRCAHCKREAECKLEHMKPYCRHCFCELIEKRVRKELRTAGNLKANETIMLIDDGSKESAVGSYLLHNISKSIPLTIKSVSSIEEAEAQGSEEQRIAVCQSATMIAEDFLGELFYNTQDKKEEKKYLEVLSCVSEEEIITFANFRNLKYQSGESHHPMKEVLEKIESQYSGSTFGITKAKKILKKD